MPFPFKLSKAFVVAVLAGAANILSDPRDVQRWVVSIAAIAAASTGGANKATGRPAAMIVGPDGRTMLATPPGGVSTQPDRRI